MKFLNLPHLPHKIDVKILKFLQQLVILPPDCFIKVSLMSKNKARPKLTPIDLKTIHGLVRNKDLDLVKNFISDFGQGVINEVDKDGYTPMHWAALEGTCEIFRYLLDLDADYENSHDNSNGQKPIHWACIKGRFDIVSILIEKGIDINFQDKRGYTPILSACMYGHQALVAFLVSRGAKLEIDDSNGDSCLHWAAYKGHPDLTRLLIIYGVYPKKIDAYGQTVLHLACLGGNLNIVQQLIEQDSIDTEIRDKNGKKAIDLAKSMGNSEIVDLIDRHYRNRRNYGCHMKAFLFGPVGNSRTIVFFIHALHWLYEYPVFFFKVGPDLWKDQYELGMLYVVLSFFMWVFFYSTMLKEPGYLKQDTEEYQQTLKRITFQSQNFTQEDWTKNLTRLCHSCKAIKPLRASHCRLCNRCVLAFDHHCPYVQNCVGYNNRVYFFLFIVTCFAVQLITLYLGYLTFCRDLYQYILWPGFLLVVLYCVMVGLLVFGAMTGALINLTTNELAKKKKYEYLQMSVKPNGRKTSLFDKGCFYNCKYYFHLTEPSPLEIEEFNPYDNYIV